jgi:hypothetical protein
MCFFEQIPLIKERDFSTKESVQGYRSWEQPICWSWEQLLACRVSLKGPRGCVHVIICTGAARSPAFLLCNKQCV